MKKFKLGCRFSFEVYANIFRQKATKCSLKNVEVLLDAVRHVLSLIFFRVQYLQIVLRTTKTLDALTFFKKRLSDVRSEIHLVRRNIASTGQSVQA